MKRVLVSTVAVLSLLLIAGGVVEGRDRTTYQNQLSVCRALGTQSGDAWRYQPGSGCYQENPWTGTWTRLDIP